MIRPGALAGANAVFFGRTGGVSEGRYASLNCGLGSGDDPARIRANRAVAMERMGLPAGALATGYQVHGIDVAVVTEAWAPDARPKVDGLVANRPGIALGILTADCAPVLFVDPEAGAIGACHAGWRGAKAGIAEATIGAMARLGARRERIAAAIGPTIAQGSYEVGADFAEAFLAEDPANARHFAPGRNADKRQFDLPGYLAARLARAGIGRVENVARDTCADEAGYFSWRRTSLAGERDYGRNLSAIALKT
jgi:YfiH family protein